MRGIGLSGRKDSGRTTTHRISKAYEDSKRLSPTVLVNVSTTSWSRNSASKILKAFSGVAYVKKKATSPLSVVPNLYPDLHEESCKGFICTILRQIVDSTVGGVVQLVRILHCHSQFPHVFDKTHEESA